MQHFHLDEFAKKNTFLHKIDPRVKIVATIAFIFLTVGVNSPAILSFAALFWLVLLLSAKVPFLYIVNRIAWIIPFAGVMILVFPFIKPGEAIWQGDFLVFSVTATKEGVQQAVVLLGRVLASILAVLFLTLTTRFHYLLKGLHMLKVPPVLLQLLEFTVRYIFVTMDELKRMRRARKARAFVAGNSLFNMHTLRTLGLLVGSLFIRSYERGERVYLAMLSRGYSGAMKTLHEFRMTALDVIWACLVIIFGLALVFVDKGGG